MLAWQPPMVMALVMIRINFDYHPHGGLIPLMNIMFGNPMPNQCLGYSLVQVVLLARRCSYTSNKYLLSFWTISSFPAAVWTESQCSGGAMFLFQSLQWVQVHKPLVSTWGSDFNTNMESSSSSKRFATWHASKHHIFFLNYYCWRLGCGRNTLFDF